MAQPLIGSPSIAWHRRLEARVVAGVSLLIAISIGALLFATTRVVTDRALQDASEDLDAARAAFYRLVDTRAQTASAQVRLITGLPVFRAHLNDARLTRDVNTVSAMAEDYRRQLAAQFAVVTDPTGRWISGPGLATNETPIALRAGIDAALGGRASRDIVPIHDQLFLVVSEPARFAEEVLGTLTVGYALDDAVARDLAKVTQCEVNLMAGDHLSGSSLERDREQLASRLAGSDLRDERGVSLAVRRLGDLEYITGTFPLVQGGASDGPGRLVLLKDWRPTQQFLDRWRRQVLIFGVVIFTCAVAGGLVLSKRMSRQLTDIATAAGDIAAGNWTRKVPVRGSAEATTMATAFNEMSTSLRHWHEEARGKSERLEASYQRFYSITESARDAIVSTDERGAITFWNRSAGTIFGYREDEGLGEHMVRFIAEPHRQTYLDAVGSLEFAAGLTFGRTIEIIAVRKDGTEFPVEFSLSTWQSDGASFVTAVVRDVTERKQAEENLRQRDEQLRQAQKMEAIGRLAGGVAHDFNNLLTVIRGYADMVVDGLDAADRRRVDAGEIMKAADRAAGLTRQLLAFSRKQMVAPQVLALDQIVTGTENMLRRLIGEDIELTSRTAAPLGRVRADAGQIEQILLNLAVNARDAMPEGGQLRIALANADIDAASAAGHPTLRPGAYVALDVVDTGCGMDAETVSHIFEPFFTTKEEGQGTGLGLATVYSIVQQSGGTIEVASEPGVGTTFRIYLPKVDAPEPIAVAQAQPHGEVRGSETVLLVEDDERVRHLIGGILRKHGYDVFEAGLGAEALTIAAAHPTPIHLLLTDVVMPGMSGRVLAERLTALRADLRVLFMSGYSDDAVLRHGIQSHGIHFLQKPFKTDELTAKIRQVLAAPLAVGRPDAGTPAPCREAWGLT